MSLKSGEAKFESQLCHLIPCVTLGILPNLCLHNEVMMNN